MKCFFSRQKIQSNAFLFSNETLNDLSFKFFAAKTCSSTIFEDGSFKSQVSTAAEILIFDNQFSAEKTQETVAKVQEESLIYQTQEEKG